MKLNHLLNPLVRFRCWGMAWVSASTWLSSRSIGYLHALKALAAVLWFCALSMSAQETTNKVVERRNPDGALRWRIETTSRGKTPVFRIHQSFKAGKMTATRSYMVGGETVMMEADEDGDGFFEIMVAYQPSKKDIEVFTRERDGTVRPVSAQTLAAYKKQHAAIDDLWDHAFDEDMDADKFIDRMQNTQQKIREAEKEKK